MATKITDTQNYINIAEAIRARNGEETLYLPSEMAAAILTLPSNGTPIEVATAAEMDAVLTDATNEGKFYLYTGTTTATYTNGAVYLCYNDSNSVY